MAPFQAPAILLRQLLVHEQDRRCHVSSHSLQAAFPSRSCVFDPGTRRHAFGLRVSLRHPIFTTGSMPFWLADAAKETTALFVLFSFQHCLRLCPHDALHRFTALYGHWPFAGDSGASDWQPMDYFKEEFEAFMFLFFYRSASSTGFPCRSLRCTPAYWLDFLSYVSTDSSLFQCKPDTSRCRKEMTMVAPYCHPLYGTACAVGLI